MSNALKIRNNDSEVEGGKSLKSPTFAGVEQNRVTETSKRLLEKTVNLKQKNYQFYENKTPGIKATKKAKKQAKKMVAKILN